MVTLEEAREIIAAAEKKAKELGQPMNIAVADGGGNLVAHVRMDEAWLGSIDIRAGTVRRRVAGHDARRRGRRRPP